MRSFMMMAVLLLFSGCAVQISDFQACSPIPGTDLAACDNFLTNNPQTVNWTEEEAAWMKQGYAVECVNSDALGSIKAEIEQLCSVATCDYPTEQKILAGLKKIEGLGK